MRSRSLTVILMLALVALPLAVPVAAAETPDNRECTAVAAVPLLCAGADAGATSECVSTSQTEVTCTYSYGWNLEASSPALPGGGQLEWTASVVACIEGLCSAQLIPDGDQTCAWTVNAAQPCTEQSVTEGSDDFVLELGECVTLTVTVSASAEAWSPDAEDPVLHVAAGQTTSDSGSACALDDGR